MINNHRSLIDRYLTHATRCSPYELLRNLQRELSAFDQGRQHLLRGREGAVEGMRLAKRLDYPHTDIFERDDGYLVVFEVPNCQHDDIELTATKESVTLRANIEKEILNERYPLRRQRVARSFRKRLNFEKEIDPETIHAELKHNTLEVSIKKRTPDRAQTVSIDVE